MSISTVVRQLRSIESARAFFPGNPDAVRGQVDSLLHAVPVVRSDRTGGIQGGVTWIAPTAGGALAAFKKHVPVADRETMVQAVAEAIGCEAKAVQLLRRWVEFDPSRESSGPTELLVLCRRPRGAPVGETLALLDDIVPGWGSEHAPAFVYDRDPAFEITRSDVEAAHSRAERHGSSMYPTVWIESPTATIWTDLRSSGGDQIWVRFRDSATEDDVRSLVDASAAFITRFAGWAGSIDLDVSEFLPYAIRGGGDRLYDAAWWQRLRPDQLEKLDASLQSTTQDGVVVFGDMAMWRDAPQSARSTARANLAELL